MGLNRSEGGPDKAARLPKGWTGPVSMSGNPGEETRLGLFFALILLPGRVRIPPHLNAHLYMNYFP
jgi:hypothetical protein